MSREQIAQCVWQTHLALRSESDETLNKLRTHTHTHTHTHTGTNRGRARAAARRRFWPFSPDPRARPLWPQSKLYPSEAIIMIATRSLTRRMPQVANDRSLTCGLNLSSPVHHFEGAQTCARHCALTLIICLVASRAHCSQPAARKTRSLIICASVFALAHNSN